MFTNPLLANYLLAVFIGVSLTKPAFDMLGPTRTQLSNWLTRIWAIALGVIVVAVDNKYGNTGLVTGYEAIKTGLQAGIGAIIVYHVGTGDFIGFFDQNALTIGATMTAVSIEQPPPVIKEVPAKVTVASGGTQTVPTPVDGDFNYKAQSVAVPAQATTTTVASGTAGVTPPDAQVGS